MNEKVTGKKIIADCVTLAKDLGVYIADIGKLLYTKIKKALDSADKEKKEEKPTVAAPNA